MLALSDNQLAVVMTAARGFSGLALRGLIQGSAA
jgi:hypothetical protein